MTFLALQLWILFLILDTFESFAPAFTFNDGLDKIFILGNNTGKVYSLNVESPTPSEYRICSDDSCSNILYDWRSDGSGQVSNGNYIQLRAMTAKAIKATISTTITIGGVSSTWEVQTK